MITQGSTTITLSYDGEHARVKMVGPSGTTIYLNDPVSGSMSEKRIAGTSFTWTDYIMADGHIVAQRTSGASTSVRYFVADHLGSVAVVTDEAAAVVERDAFDAWGRRRNLDGSDSTTCALPSVTTRGYTGHEQLDATCLINANARLYDPAIGRFLAADTMIP
jgi:RHS repeat-associated protein